MKENILCNIFKILKGKKCKCVHDPNSTFTSLKEINLKKMTYPQKYYFECNNCGKIFEFEKKEGKYF